MKFNKVVKSIPTQPILKRFASAYVMDHRNFSEEELLNALNTTAPQYFYQENVNKALSDLSLHQERKYRLLSSILIKEVLLN